MCQSSESFVEPCKYYKNKSATYHVVPDDKSHSNRLNIEDLLANGYRKKDGNYIKNICPDCNECIPIRIEIKKFQPKRLKGLIKKNSDIKVVVCDNSYSEKDLSFFNAFQKERFNNNCLSKEDYLEKYCSCSHKIYYYLQDELIGICIFDSTLDSVYGKYFSYNINYSKRSLGIFNVLKTLEYGNQTNKTYFYLGFYLKNISHMNYKSRFKPYQLLIDNEWTNYN